MYPTCLWLLPLLLVVGGVVRGEKLQQVTVAGEGQEEVGRPLTAESDRSRINGGICLMRREKIKNKAASSTFPCGEGGSEEEEDGVGGRLMAAGGEGVPWGRK